LPYCPDKSISFGILETCLSDCSVVVRLATSIAIPSLPNPE
jgi:hypothetical protein